MLQTAIRLLMSRPQWVAAHLEAHIALLSLEISGAAALLRRRWILQIVGLLCWAFGVGIAAVALLLWGVIPPTQMPHAWVLWAAPALPLSIGTVALLLRPNASIKDRLETTVVQLRDDIAMLQTAGLSPQSDP